MQAVEMFEAGWPLKDMLRFAQFAVEFRKGDKVSMGFMDAVIERC